VKFSRRDVLTSYMAAPVLLKAQSPATQAEPDAQESLDWTCPMDPDVRLDKPGKCPRCGMTLVLKVPDRVEYELQVELHPPVLQSGDEALLTLRPIDPEGKPVIRYEVVHEKLIHLFIVSEDLEFFTHIHPALDGGAFRIQTRFPRAGMYRLLADYYPTGSVPQLSLSTLYVNGARSRPHLQTSLSPQQSANLTANLRTEPQQPVAGLLTRLFFDLNPYEGVEPYLDAWGHMLIASEDLVDLIHLHPFLVAQPTIQFNVIFPRPGLHRIWTQFQRRGVVNTVEFTVPVRAI